MAHGNVIKKRLLATLLLLLGGAGVTASLSEEHAFAHDSTVPLASLTFVTEEYPPYNYLDGNRLSGRSVDLLQTMLANAGHSLDRNDIRYYPWVRGYELALHRPNTVLFSTTRTPSRESLFHWVGPIARDRVVLLARQGSPLRVASLEDAIEQGLSVAVIREDIGAQALAEAGYPDALMRPAMDNRSALHMLLRERVDLWAYSADVAQWIVEQAGYPAKSVTPLYTLSESYLYFALNLETNPQLVQRLQQAFEGVMPAPATLDADNDG